MAPAALRKPVAKDRFPSLFSTLKTQSYYDPASRGPGSHTIRTIAWNPTGHLIATGSVDRILRIWNPEKPQVKNSTELKGHSGAIEKVAWNPTKEAELASVSSDGTCKFWDVRSKTCIATIQLPEPGLTICWSADGEVAVAGTIRDSLIPIHRNPAPTPDPPLKQGIQTNQLTFSHTMPPSHLLLTRGDGSVVVSAYPSLAPLHTLQAHTSSCLSLELSPNGRYLAIGGTDALITLYDTWDWACKRTITSYVGAVKSVSFSFDGSYILGGCEEGRELEVVHVESGEVVGKVEGGAGSGLAGGGIGGGGVGGGGHGNIGGGQVAWHPARYWVAFAGEGGGLRILGAAGGQL